MKKVSITLVRILMLLPVGLHTLGTLYAQGICIPKPLTVHAVEGRVLFEAAGAAEPLSGVTVEIAPYGYQKPALSKVITANDGRFEFGAVTPGRYYLSTQHPGIIGMRLEIRVESTKKGRKAQDIEFVLRNDPGRTCGGGSVTLAAAKNASNDLVIRATLLEIAPDPGVQSGVAAVYRFARYRIDGMCMGRVDNGSKEIIVGHLVPLESQLPTSLGSGSALTLKATTSDPDD